MRYYLFWQVKSQAPLPDKALMARNLLIAASGLEPLQTLFRNLTWIVLLLIAFMVVGTILLLLIKMTASGLETQRASVRPVPEWQPNPPVSASARTPVATVPRSSREVPLSMKLRAIDWFQFEKLIEIVYRKKGYLVDRRGGANPDGGLDLILIKDAEKVGVQCKHWKTWDIGVQTTRELVGAMQDAKISKGLLVTISRFTKDAQECATRNNIQMVDSADLEKLINSVDGRYDPEIQALLEDRRKVCPKCERPMELRTAKKGRYAGRQFWGCSGFKTKQCSHTEDYV